MVPQVNNPKPGWGGFIYLDELQAKTDKDGRFTLEGMPEVVTSMSSTRPTARSGAGRSRRRTSRRT